MVHVGEILKKLSPKLKYSDRIMKYEIGDYDFDTFKQTSEFTYEYTNSKNPNIKLRIRDDFPFRVVVLEKKGNTTYGTTFNGDIQVKWKREDEGLIEHIG